jgi:hypothetical protein
MKSIREPLAIASAIVAMAAAAPAAAVVVDFEGVTLTNGTGNNAAVQSYLNGLLGPGFVTVYGAVADRAYDGDGHVNRNPNAGANFNRPVTLGTTNGATSPTDYTHFHPGLDTFIRNVGTDGGSNTAWGINPSGSVGRDKFVFVFSSPIHSVSFDWEVFPDGTCGSCTGGPNFPDFELWAGVNGAASPLFTFGPGAPNFPVTVPNGFAQGIGHFSASFAQGVTRLEFVDWPQRIGIDNFDSTTQVPEPATLALLAFALATLTFAQRRKRATGRPSGGELGRLV